MLAHNALSASVEKESPLCRNMAIVYSNKRTMRRKERKYGGGENGFFVDRILLSDASIHGTCAD